MNDADRDLLLSHLQNAPGPAPWYTRGTAAGLTRRSHELRWGAPDSECAFEGHVPLFEDGGEKDNGFPLLLLKTTTFAGIVEGNRLLLAGKLKNPDVLDVTLHRGDNFVPISNIPVACRMLAAPDRTHHAASGPLAHVQIPRRLVGGKHPFRFPALFAGIQEVILPTTLHKPGAPSTGPELTALVILHPTDHTIEVIPQDWYNDGSYRPGYQWITRAARDPLEGQILLEGIRIGRALLNAEGTQIEQWIDENPTHMP